MFGSPHTRNYGWSQGNDILEPVPFDVSTVALRKEPEKNNFCTVVFVCISATQKETGRWRQMYRLLTPAALMRFCRQPNRLCLSASCPLNLSFLPQVANTDMKRTLPKEGSWLAKVGCARFIHVRIHHEGTSRCPRIAWQVGCSSANARSCETETVGNVIMPVQILQRYGGQYILASQILAGIASICLCISTTFWQL